MIVKSVLCFHKVDPQKYCKKIIKINKITE